MTNEPTKIGYARVSTEEQSVDMQIEALKRAGVLEENIFSESFSGSLKDRPQLNAAFKAIMQFHMLGAFAQFERDIIRERTQAGVDRAKRRGVKFGAKHKIEPDEMPKIWNMVNKKAMTHKSVAKKYNVSEQTISRRLKEYEASDEFKKR